LSITVHSYEARLLGPFTYHSVPDAGAAGATVTAPFLGDTALTYAMHYALLGHPIPNRFGYSDNGQDYKGDYRYFKSICSVGTPRTIVEYLPTEYVASSFMSEGYEQKRISSMDSKHRKSKVGNTAWRPWRQIQSLAPSRGDINVFTFIAVSPEHLPEHFTVRIGLGRSCLLDIKETKQLDTFSVNRQTIETVLGRNMKDVPYTSISAPIAQFQIYHGVPIKYAENLLTPVSDW
jgi:hypothetical protein